MTPRVEKLSHRLTWRAETRVYIDKMRSGVSESDDVSAASDEEESTAWTPVGLRSRGPYLCMRRVLCQHWGCRVLCQHCRPAAPRARAGNRNKDFGVCLIDDVDLRVRFGSSFIGVGHRTATVTYCVFLMHLLREQEGHQNGAHADVATTAAGNKDGVVLSVGTPPRRTGTGRGPRRAHRPRRGMGPVRRGAADRTTLLAQRGHLLGGRAVHAVGWLKAPRFNARNRSVKTARFQAMVSTGSLHPYVVESVVEAPLERTRAAALAHAVVQLLLSHPPPGVGCYCRI